jgi:TonB family protein
VDEKLVADGKIDIRPPYPAEAQAQRLTGNGVYVLHVDPTNGSVASVAIEKSTGHKILDEAAVTTFTNLRFKPHGALRVKIPVTFTIPPDTNGPRVTRNFPATWLAEAQPVRVSSGKATGRK